jgi:hypothetical protein
VRLEDLQALLDRSTLGSPAAKYISTLPKENWMRLEDVLASIRVFAAVALEPTAGGDVDVSDFEIHTYPEEYVFEIRIPKPKQTQTPG